MPREDNLQQLVQRWTDGEEQAFDKLVEIVYDDLRTIAHSHLKYERKDHTLNTTALVNEAYMAMAKRTGPDWRGRPQFFALVSKVMRQLLIDHARKRNTLKRGARDIQVPLNEATIATNTELDRLISLDQALDQLEERDERMARIVECRYFGGMPHGEIAKALGVSLRTVEREWSRARTYLFATLSPIAPPEESAS